MFEDKYGAVFEVMSILPCVRIMYTGSFLPILFRRDYIFVCMCVCKLRSFCLFNLLALFPIQSGARINISEGNCAERIITLAGPTNAIFKACVMIIDKLEEDISSSMTNSTAASRPPVTLRLMVPAGQCSSHWERWLQDQGNRREYRGSGPGGRGNAPQLD